MEVRRLRAVMRRWWWLLALGPLVGAGAAVAVFAGRPPVFKASGTLLVQLPPAPDGSGYYDLLANQHLAKTFSELVAAPPVLDTVARNRGLPERHGLNKRIEATLRRETSLIDITARSSDAAEAAALVNDTAAVFAALAGRLQDGPRAQGGAAAAATAQAAAVPTAAALTAEPAPVLVPPAVGLGPGGVPPATPAPSAAQPEPAPQPTAAPAPAPRRASVTLVTPAEIPNEPAGLPVVLTVILGAALGLLATGAVVTAAEYADGSVKTAAATAKAAGAPLLGAVARFRSTRRGRLLTDLPAGEQAAEAYRLLALTLPPSAERGLALLVTSARDGEGATTTAANVALALAMSGRNVILVDADYRRPALHGLFAVTNAAGLSSLLSGRSGDGDELCPTMLPNLRLLPAGPLPASSAELVTPATADRVLAELRRRADVVLIDGPALLRSADAAVWAARVDGVAIVAEWGRTGAGTLANAAGVLRRSGARLWGVVLNKAPGSEVDDLFEAGPMGAVAAGATDIGTAGADMHAARERLVSNGRAPGPAAVGPDTR